MAGMWPRLRAALAEPGLTPTLILSSRAHLTARRRLWGTCQHRQHWASWMSAKGLRGDRVPVRSGFTLGHEAWGQEMIRRGGRRKRGPPASDGSRGKCPPGREGGGHGQRRSRLGQPGKHPGPWLRTQASGLAAFVHQLHLPQLFPGEADANGIEFVPDTQIEGSAGSW